MKRLRQTFGIQDRTRRLEAFPPFDTPHRKAIRSVGVLRKIKAPRQGGISPQARRMFNFALLCLA